ncbi:uncharacterized protein LOC117207322 [Bombus bifarius]|uniref:Uncharacterized protein LOC117207322 n=1 Tax=Bombus bifarius TaxID=103933 RepID=A0A6P8LXX6_9HYME|nr:uncharacterized protein LOC117207322 [Bombus bifarius]
MEQESCIVRRGWKTTEKLLSEQFVRRVVLSGTTVPEDRESEQGKSGSEWRPLLRVVPSWRGHVAFSEDNDDDEGEIASQDPGEEEKRDECGRGEAYHEAVASDQFGGRAEPARTSSPIVNRQVYFRSGETFAFNTNGYSGSQNVGGLYELQGCELCRHHAAVKLGFRWRVRKRLLRIRKLLHNYKKSTGTRQGAVRLWQGDRQLASSRESRQALISVLLVLLSSGLSKSATNHETLRSSSAKVSSTLRPTNESTFDDRSNRDDDNSEAIETLFIPENLSQYEQILLYVRELFQGVEQSADLYDQEVPASLERNVTDSTSDEDRFSKLEERVREWNSPSDREEDEEKYPQRNPEGGVSLGTTVQDNRMDDVISTERNNYDAGYKGKTEPDEEDLLEAANFGLDAMKDLYTVKEPKLYSMGLYLDSDNPARHVAVFNEQTEEARFLAKYGYAVLQGTTLFRRKFPNTPADSLLSRRSQSNPLQRGCPNRGVPNCPAASLRYRTSDGSCNNLHHLWWGSAMSTMQRFLPSVYDDGIQSIRKSVTGRPLPSARLVTTVIHEDKDVPLEAVTHMLMQWGQFVDHDLTATGQGRGFNGSIPQCCLKFGSGFQPPEFMHPECLPISVSKHDNFFGPLDVKCLEFVRSGSAPKEDCEFGPREQLSQVTSYLDASVVYSNSAFQTDSLRLFRNGLLQYGRIQSQRPVLPKLDSDLCRRGSLSTNCFKAGDGRLGEQPALTSLHVAFLRLHNRIATKLAALNAHWSDEKLFQESRRIVASIVQHITYREFLPIVLGQDVMKIFDLELLKKGYYEGYDPTVKPTVANAFSTAAYRFGHSLVQQSFVRFNSDHQPIFNNVSIHNEFMNPANLETAGSVDRLLLGLINQNAQRRDEHISEELTNHLFQTPRFPFGMDLASINIQRGRDHGIPPYVRWREPCALSPIKNFDDLERVMPPSTARKFKLVYSSVEDIDLFTGGLAEKSVKSGLVGPTFACIIGQQFNNIRRGDRFWYENSKQEGSFTPGQLQQIRRVTLAQVLCSTMDSIETIQPFVFLTQDTLKNQRRPCNDSIIGQLNLESWAERGPKFRREGIIDKIKKYASVSTTTSKSTDLYSHNLNPAKTSVQQQNRIVVKKPFGPADNLTIVVQNNAINSPVFVNDAIYGSNIKVNPSLVQEVQQRPVSEGSMPIPTYLPAKPVIIAHPLGNPAYPYVPYAFNDPNNPNPLSQGYRPSYSSDVVFDSFPGTSPRPTLYTYYTNFQKLTTQKPSQDVDAYITNYKTQDHGSKPSSWTNLQYQSQSSSKPVYSFTQRPQDVDAYITNYKPQDHGSKPSSWPNSQYQSQPSSKPVYSSTQRPQDVDAYIANYKPHDHGSELNSWPNSQYQSQPSSKPVYSSTQRPQDVDAHVANYKPHDHGPELNSWPNSQYQSQPSAKPVYDSPEHNNQGHGINIWQKLQYKPVVLVGQTDSGNLQSYAQTSNHPQSYLKDSEDTYIKPANSQHDYVKDFENRYTTWSTISSDKKTEDTVVNDPHYRPYQEPNRKPIQSSYGSSYQIDFPGRPTASLNDKGTTVHPNAFYLSSSARPISNNEYNKEFSSWPASQNDYDIATHSTPVYRPAQHVSDYQTSKPENSYQNVQPKPSKIHSVTIITASQSGNEVDRLENRVTSEVPRPLNTQIANDRAKRPGQYYYEKNVLHRYPDKMEDQPAYNAEQRHKSTSDEVSIDDTLIVASVRNQLIDGNGNNTDVKTMSQTRNESSDSTTSDDVDYGLGDAFSEETEIPPSYRTSHWLNPHEDTSLPSALEMPKIPSDKTSAAKELPKPMKLRNYAA